MPGDSNQQTTQQNNGSQQPLTWDTWHGALEKKKKKLIEEHTTGLRNALDIERNGKKELEKQLKAVQAKAEKGSEFEKQLADTLSALGQERRQRVFTESAMAAKATDVKLLWLAASSDKLVDDEGKADFENLKKQYPQLFQQKQQAPPSHAGAGRGGQGGGFNMNDAIRAAAGRAPTS